MVKFIGTQIEATGNWLKLAESFLIKLAHTLNVMACDIRLLENVPELSTNGLKLSAFCFFKSLYK